MLPDTWEWRRKSGIDCREGHEPAWWFVITFPWKQLINNKIKDFSLPSLASIFPFLEGTCPKDSPTWHITRARLLQHYVSAWVLYTEDTDTPQKTLISFSGNLLVDMDGLSIGKGHTFFLLLLPRFWSMEGVHNKLMAACARVISSGKPGSVITKVGFENLWN